MKYRRIILSILSALLITVILIGSTGINIVIKSCNSCGITVNTHLFETATENQQSCCGNSISQCASNEKERLEKGCCTFTSEKLKLSNYVPSEPVTLSIFAYIKPPNDLPVVPELLIHQTIPLFVHNKHGGRYIIITNCQFLT